MKGKKKEKAQVNKHKFPTILAGSIDQRPCIYSIIKKGKILCVEARWDGQAWSGAGVDAMIKNNGEARIRRRQIGRPIMVARDECEKRIAWLVLSPRLFQF